jgi:SAM-dependent methyltransferase
VVAVLSGLKPASVASCRVLEIGCARGGNLIPMAVGLPGSSFLGIDSSAGQVASARSVIDALCLDNIAIECRSVLDVGAELGAFDYIICHGTYSCVPAEVRDRILEVLARNLAPHGAAFLSYNTFPGWRLHGLVRDLMTYHAGRYDRPDDRAREARLVLEFMAAAAAPFDRDYANWLREECEHLRRKPDSYLLHDQLEEFNERSTSTRWSRGRRRRASGSSRRCRPVRWHRRASRLRYSTSCGGSRAMRSSSSNSWIS